MFSWTKLGLIELIYISLTDLVKFLLDKYMFNKGNYSVDFMIKPSWQWNVIWVYSLTINLILNKSKSAHIARLFFFYQPTDKTVQL